VNGSPANDAAAAVPDAPAVVEDARTGFAGLPRWLRIGIIAAATAVLVLVIAVIIRIILQTPVIPLGVTKAEDLVPGACLLEPGNSEAEYTVVGCATPHQQQIIARVDLNFPGVPYSADESLAIYARETCKRLIEYRLYLPQDIVKTDYDGDAVNPPTLAEYDSGKTVTLCAVFDHPDRPVEGAGSEDLTRDLYRPIPQ
jgi:hypothetical protein